MILTKFTFDTRTEKLMEVNNLGERYYMFDAINQDTAEMQKKHGGAVVQTVLNNRTVQDPNGKWNVAYALAYEDGVTLLAGIKVGDVTVVYASMKTA
ncbi:hypothetical protein PODOV045v1_p0004 [Vibrio phage 69E27.1]|nr:hypothetical protein PODOV045v1_p0004 [Vibrio phage 69E27.1]